MLTMYTDVGSFTRYDAKVTFYGKSWIMYWQGSQGPKGGTYDNTIQYHIMLTPLPLKSFDLKPKRFLVFVLLRVISGQSCLDH